MLTTAEAADVMKKPIHKEIIILQNYFKSMRAKTDGVAGWRGQAAVTPGVLPLSGRPPLRAGQPGSGGQGTSKPPAPAAGQSVHEKY